MRTAEVEELFDAPVARWSPRRFLVAALALVMISGLIAVAIVSRSSPDALAELRVRKGSVSLLRETLPVSRAAEGEDLRSGDLVRTDEQGQAQVDFFDESLVRMDVSTELALNTVSEKDSSRTIELALAAGRLWSRVTPRRSGDTFSVDIGDAVVSAVGTTFLVDCTEGSVCYVVAVDSTSEVRSDSGRALQAKEGDCVRVATDGRLESCDETELGLLDDWVKENLAQDAQLTLERVETTATPSPTATGSGSGSVSRPAAPGGGSGPAGPPAQPTPKPTPTEVPERTPTPDPEPDLTPRPRRTKRPATPTPPATAPPAPTVPAGSNQ